MRYYGGTHNVETSSPEFAVVLKRHADAVATAALAIALVATLMTTSKVRAATAMTQRANRAAFAESTLTRVLNQTIRLGRLSGELAPPVLAQILDGLARPEDDQGFIVFVYTPQACERSIKEGLQTIRALEDSLRDLRLNVVVVIGADSATSKELALLTRDDIEYRSPLRFAPRTELEQALFDHTDRLFGEEPIALFIDQRNRVLSAIHTDQFRPEILRAWLRQRLEVRRGRKA